MPLSAGAVLWIADIGLAVGSLRRRPVLLVSLCATTACDAAISASIAFQNLPVLGFATLVAGLAEGNIVIAQGRLPTSSRPHSAIATSAIFMASGLAYIIGPLGGGKLADPTLVPWFSDATPFWASFALLVLTTLTVLVLFREARAHHQPRRLRLLETFGSLLQVFANPQLRRYYIVNFPLYLAIFGFFRSYPMYLVDRFHLNVSRAFRSSWPGWVCRSCSPISG